MHNLSCGFTQSTGQTAQVIIQGSAVATPKSETTVSVDIDRSPVSFSHQSASVAKDAIEQTIAAVQAETPAVKHYRALPSSSTWSFEQDYDLLRYAIIGWKAPEIAEDLGKDVQSCTARLNVLLARKTARDTAQFTPRQVIAGPAAILGLTPATAATWFCGVVMGGALCLLAYHAAPTIIWAMSLQPHHGPHLTCNPDPAICLFTGAAK